MTANTNLHKILQLPTKTILFSRELNMSSIMCSLVEMWNMIGVKNNDRSSTT